jgi:hypothetical protein
MADRQFSYITNKIKFKKKKEKKKNLTLVHDFYFIFQISDVASLGARVPRAPI